MPVAKKMNKVDNMEKEDTYDHLNSDDVINKDAPLGRFIRYF
jgi:hypothetical protein